MVININKLSCKKRQGQAAVAGLCEIKNNYFLEEEMVKSYLKRSILALSAAAIVTGGVVGVANAALTDTGAVNIAAQSATAVLGNQDTSIDLVYAATAAIPVNSIMTLTLSGGAVFKGTMTAQPTTALTACDLGAGPGAATNGVGGAGTDTLTWNFIAAAPIADDITFATNTGADGIDMTGVANGASAQLTVKIIDGGAGADIGDSPQTDGGKLSLVNIVEIDAAADRASASTELVASSGYAEFTANGLVSDADVLKVTNNTTGQTLTAGTDTLVCTYSGDFVGIDSDGVDAAGAVTSALVTGADPTAAPGTVAGEYFINSASTAASAKPAGNIASAGSLDFGVTLTLDGTTSQSARTFTAGCDLIGSANYLADSGIVGSANAQTFTRDGASIMLTYTNALNNDPNEQAIVIREMAGAAAMPATGARVLIEVITPGATNGEGSKSAATDTGFVVQGDGTLMVTPAQLIEGAGLTAANNQQINIIVESSSVSFTNLHGAMSGWSNNNGTEGTM